MIERLETRVIELIQLHRRRRTSVPVRLSQELELPTRKITDQERKEPSPDPNAHYHVSGKENHMRLRFLSLTVAITGSALAPALMSGQSQGRTTITTDKASTTPLTPWGHPDLQGTWNIATLTPVERPDTVGGKLSLTKEEADAIERAERGRLEALARSSDPNRPAPAIGGNVGGYNNFWIDRGSSSFVVDGQYRTSIIVDPPDGKIPAMTPEAQARDAARGGLAARPDVVERQATDNRQGYYDHPEQRPLAERCILGFGWTSGPPTLPNYFYNNLKQIVQTPNAVMILVEMNHDARIIRLDSQHQPTHIQKWMGDSTGHWEGDTLVVETTNFTTKTRFRGSSENLKVIERFRRVDEDTILYRFTVEDPSTWAQSWSGEYPWERSNDPLYEYACHEGNYALGAVMRGERILDKERATMKAAEKK